MFWSLTLKSISWESIHLTSQVIVEHLPLKHVDSEASLHLTRAESQAATMVGVPQGFDIGPFW